MTPCFTGSRRYNHWQLHWDVCLRNLRISRHSLCQVWLPILLQVLHWRYIKTRKVSPRDLSPDAADAKTGADDFIFGNAAAWFGDCELSVANYVFRDWRIRVLTKIQALSHAAAAAPSLLITEHQPVTPHGMFSTHPRSQRHLGGRRLGQTTWAGPGALIQELSSRNALWAMWSTPLAGRPWPRERPRKSSIF